MRTLLLLLSLGYFFGVKAQTSTFADSSAQWIYVTQTSEWPWAPLPSDFTTSRYFLSGDTITNSQVYTKVYFQHSVTSLSQSQYTAYLNLLMRIDGGRVSLHRLTDTDSWNLFLPVTNPQVDEPIVIFDFDALVGDTITHLVTINPYNQGIDSIYSVITEKDSVLENGTWYRTYSAIEYQSHRDAIGNWDSEIIGDFGSYKREPFGSAQTGLFGVFIPLSALNTISWMSCFDSDDFQFSSNSWTTCLNVSIPKTPESENCMVIKGSLIELNCGPGQARVSVTNTMGQIVYSATLSQNETLDLSHLLKGVYVLSMESKTFSTSKKVAVID